MRWSPRASVWLFLLASCATGSNSSAPLPDPDSSSDSAGPDASFLDSSGQDWDAPSDSDTSADQEASENDAMPQEPDACVIDSAPPDSQEPCTAGQLQRIWCGRCGKQQRRCLPDLTWGPWSSCIEDPEAQCSPCETKTVHCGNCGQRSVYCDSRNDKCRWVLGSCSSFGQCAPGAYQQASCAPDAVQWCQGDCHWDSAGSCTPAPHWDSLSPGPIANRQGLGWVNLGRRLWLWGGMRSDGTFSSDGAQWDGRVNLWLVMPPAQWSREDGGTASFAPRAWMSTLALDAALFFWAGQGGPDPSSPQAFQDGALYDIGSNSWRPISAQGAPSPRLEAPSAWDAAEQLVLVWGGRSPVGLSVGGGARWELASGSWSPMAQGPLEPRMDHSLVWDPVHKWLLVWGGRSGSGIDAPLATGAIYEPSTDSWRPMAVAPIARAGHVAVWDEVRHKMLVLLGHDGQWWSPRGDGASYDPSTDSWQFLPDLAPTGYALGDGYAAVWGAGQLWVTGGQGDNSGPFSAQGARYQSAFDAWAPLPPMGAGRSQHHSAFLSSLVVWGGQSVSSFEQLDEMR